MHGLDEYYYIFRNYLPSTMRFTTADPLAERFPWQSPYAYADNNPIKNIDYLGLNSEDQVEKDKNEKPKEEKPKEEEPKVEKPKVEEPKVEEPNKNSPSDILKSGFASALVISQGDSPAPGPADVVAVFVVAYTLVYAGIIWGREMYDQFANEHTKNRNPANWNTHTKPRAGRATTKQRSKPGWKQTKDRKKEERK
jgi:uncharacterized protein RhaS with RHS repeats